MRWGLLLAALPVAAAAASSQPATSADDWFYEERARPLLEQRCYACHSSRVSRPQGGLRRNEAKQHWAFRPLRPVEPARTIQRAWGWTPVDRFILARLETEGLKLSPPADRRTLIRRATFDLTGLPPTPAADRKSVV